MVKKLITLAHSQTRALDRSQGGAIILLVLAGLLILLLTSMMLFDAGTSAQHTTQVQNAADSAAYSQAAVKARSMNVIAYANTSKRVMFAYHAATAGGFVSAATTNALHCSRCSFPAGLHWCVICGIGAAQIAVEVAALLAVGRRALDRLKDEIELLDELQKHLMHFTPWWGMTENMMRGVQNGATATAAWPGPEAILPSYINDAYSAILDFDQQFDTNIAVQLPPKTDIFDELPLSKRDTNFTSKLGYCNEFLLSVEHILTAFDAWNDSGGWPIVTQSSGDWLVGNLAGQATASGCYFRMGGDSIPLIDSVLDFAFPLDVEKLMDWQVDGDDWLLRTSNITLAYMNLGYDDNRDAQYDGFLNDHTERPSFKADGQWALARSEITWQPKWVENALPGGIGGALSMVLSYTPGPFGSNLFSTKSEPHMWSPRWSARLRPLVLPGEDFGDAIAGQSVGLHAIYTDMLPYFAFASTLGTVVQGSGSIFSGDLTSLGNMAGDLVYMYGVSQSYSADDMEGLTQ